MNLSFQNQTWRIFGFFILVLLFSNEFSLSAYPIYSTNIENPSINAFNVAQTDTSRYGTYQGKKVTGVSIRYNAPESEKVQITLENGRKVQMSIAQAVEAKINIPPPPPPPPPPSASRRNAPPPPPPPPPARRGADDSIRPATNTRIGGSDDSIRPATNTRTGGSDDSIRPVDKSEPIFEFTEVMPQFYGGRYSFESYLKENLRYPEIAKRAGIEGTVYVQFVVEKDGSISGATVIRAIGAGCDEEAVRLVNTMPKWIPGKQNGEVRRVKHTIQVQFKL